MNHKPQPLYIVPQRKQCPVCGASSYSASGIHPQCAMHQADTKRMAKVKPMAKSAKKATKAEYITRWQKPCPKCRTLVHIRKKTCDCGHTFATAKST
jgi:hypothetical protein